MYPSSDPVSRWLIQSEDASAYEAVGCGSAQIASTVYDFGVGSRGNKDDFRRNAGEGERSLGTEVGPSD
jgi:hypothetical protein